MRLLRSEGIHLCNTESVVKLESPELSSVICLWHIHETFNSCVSQLTSYKCYHFERETVWTMLRTLYFMALIQLRRKSFMRICDNIRRWQRKLLTDQIHTFSDLTSEKNGCKCQVYRVKQDTVLNLRHSVRPCTCSSSETFTLHKYISLFFSTIRKNCKTRRKGQIIMPIILQKLKKKLKGPTLWKINFTKVLRLINMRL